MPRILEQNATVTALQRGGGQTPSLQLSVTSDSAISRGQVTLCYAAKAVDSRREIFLKQFKQPGPRVNWYADYLAYLNALNERIDCTSCKYLTSKIFMVFESQKSIFEAMEFLHGISLKNFLESKPFSTLTAEDYKVRLHIAVCFMGALKAFHDAGIVHTDLKPENIFLEDAPGTKYGFSVKLIDLDYAIMEDAPNLPWQDAQSLAIAGTPGYFPPERYTGERYGRHSDMFTAGIILQEILCSQTPFAKSDYDNLVNPAVRSAAPQPPVFPSFVNPQIASAMGTIITRCLSPDKNSRPTASRMHQVLVQFQNAVASSSTQQPLPAMMVLQYLNKVVASSTMQQTLQPPKRRPCPATIILQGPSGAIVFNDSTKISAENLRNIDTAAAEIADRICQFSISLEGDTFTIIPNLSANSTLLVNDYAANSPIKLNKGDKIMLTNGIKSSSIIKIDIKGQI